MIQFCYASTDDELQQIVALQSINLPTTITAEELAAEGFVTVRHTRAILQRMNQLYGHTIAKVGEQVVAYALCMQKEIRDDIPTLYPLFEKIDTLQFNGAWLRDTAYYVMGQICIAKAWRGRGIFPQLYATQRRQLSAHFDYSITSVALRNPRSLRAHQKVGFQIINQYRDEAGHDWAILLWDWHSNE
ncbi:MAG: GNAT family N-acetyltransferase [Bacteroidota bacterium]